MHRAVKLLFPCLAFCVLGAGPAAASEPAPLRVFILAGQSNMEGHGFVAADPQRNGGRGSLEFLVRDPATAPRFATFATADGRWRRRDDVWISYLQRHGPLTVGYGALPEPTRPAKIGPELGFGWVLGDALEEPVLLIKCAWGGKSLAVDFRPPSAGRPPYPLGAKLDAAVAQDPAIVGRYYREMVALTRAALSRLPELVPGSDGRFVLAGFAWHQGWNDRINDQFTAEYEANLAHFIRDVRREFGVPALPFVIGETGMTGPNERHPRALALMRAQAAVAARPEFQGNVAFVGTKGFWRDVADSPNNQGYHWNSNAETYTLIGQAMAEAMRPLLGPVSPR
ncbi:MAG: sialate O-acetylesterase [Opitutaceae bacterium]